MDASEATKVVMSRIKNLDPENASKIMGYILLIQEQGDKEMIRLAFGPETLLLSHINKAKACLGLLSSTTPSSSPMPYADTTLASPRLHFYDQDHQLSLTDELNPIVVSPSGRTDFMASPFHRRSCSVNDAAFLSNLEEAGGGFLWRPCVYFARGFCKNGSTCKFLHTSDEGIEVLGSPNKDKFQELLRLKALQSHRLPLTPSGCHYPFPYHENLRHDFAPMGLGPGASSSSRQIYLTFPADSSFKEEDVSNYFSTYGPVQDVRIPYQQKRMFGFVTFVYAETVKLLLAKGNPHFVCDSRVLVKPYKEKGKVLDKKQHLGRGDYLACLSPSGADSSEHLDLPIGSRMLYDPQEMMLRRKLEEAELQHAIELQSRRMMNLQLVDLKIQHHNNHFQTRLGAGAPISSPRQSSFPMNLEHLEEFDGNREAAESPAATVDQKSVLQWTESSTENNDGCDLPETYENSLEHILPDNLFASPTKSAAEHHSAFCQADDTKTVTKSSSNNNTDLPPSISPLRTASLSSCYNQFPRFPSGQETIEM